MLSRSNFRLGAAALAAVAAFALVGCSTPDGGTSETTAAGAAPGEDCQPREGVDYEAVEEILAPYLQNEAQIPVEGTLAELPAPGTRIAFLDNGTPVAALMWDYIQTVNNVLPDVVFERVDVGTDAQSINTGLNTVLESSPDIVIAVALDPTFYVSQLEAMQERDITFVPVSITNAEDFGLEDVMGGYGSQVDNGKVLAAAGLWLTCGQGEEIAFYNVPELPFSGIQLESATEELEKLCPDCTLRPVDISVTQMSSTGPDIVVSDLQAHPNTDAFITPIDELQIGLAGKLEIAGLPNIPGIGQSSTPPNVAQIADGTQRAGLATDLRLIMWLTVDEALRRHAGMEVSYEGMDWANFNAQVSRILTQENAGEYLEGFVAVPDFEEQFAEMWGVNG